MKTDKYAAAIADDKLVSDTRIALSGIRPRPTQCQTVECSTGPYTEADWDVSKFKDGFYLKSLKTCQYNTYYPDYMRKLLGNPDYELIRVKNGKATLVYPKGKFLPDKDILINGK